MMNSSRGSQVIPVELVRESSGDRIGSLGCYKGRKRSRRDCVGAAGGEETILMTSSLAQSGKSPITDSLSQSLIETHEKYWFGG